MLLGAIITPPNPGNVPVSVSKVGVEWLSNGSFEQVATLGALGHADCGAMSGRSPVVSRSVRQSIEYQDLISWPSAIREREGFENRVGRHEHPWAAYGRPGRGRTAKASRPAACGESRSASWRSRRANKDPLRLTRQALFARRLPGRRLLPAAVLDGRVTAHGLAVQLDQRSLSRGARLFPGEVVEQFCRPAAPLSDEVLPFSGLQALRSPTMSSTVRTSDTPRATAADLPCGVAAPHTRIAPSTLDGPARDEHLVRGGVAGQRQELDERGLSETVELCRLGEPDVAVVLPGDPAFQLGRVGPAALPVPRGEVERVTPRLAGLPECRAAVAPSAALNDQSQGGDGGPGRSAHIQHVWGEGQRLTWAGPSTSCRSQ